jgi:hypothetical protein
MNNCYFSYSSYTPSANNLLQKKAKTNSRFMKSSNNQNGMFRKIMPMLLTRQLSICLGTKYLRALFLLLFFVAAIGGAPSLFGQSLTTTLPVASTVSVLPSIWTEKPFSFDSLVSCSESGLQQNNWQTELSFAQFDPSLGDLQRIELRLEGKTVASIEIEAAAIPAGQNEVKLSSQLELQLPGAQTLHMEPVAELNASTRKSREQFSGVANHQEIIEKDFQSYLGIGKLVIPATGKGYNSKDKKGPVQLYTKSALSVCITYHYQPRN